MSRARPRACARWACVGVGRAALLVAAVSVLAWRPPPMWGAGGAWGRHHLLRDAAARISLSLRRLASDANAPCAPLDPHVLVFTRIPKTGSTTLYSLIKRLAKDHGFVFQLTTPEGHPDGRSPDVLRTMIDSALRSPNRTLIALHAHFPGDSPPLRDGRVAFFSVVRSPVPRAVSRYYYLRWFAADLASKGTLLTIAPHLAPLLQSVNVTLDECLASLPPATLCNLHVLPQQCYVDTNFTEQLRLFAPADSDPGDALSTAVRVIEGHYRVVGITELLVDTIDALEGTFPSFFAGAGALFQNMDAKDRHLNSHTKRGRLWSTPSDATLAQLQSLVAYDEALYQYARERFIAQRGVCRWTLQH